MSNYLFILMRGLDETTRVRRCLRLARLAMLKGHQVSVCLMDEAVWLGHHLLHYQSRPEGMQGAETPESEICRLLHSLFAGKVRICLDRNSAQARSLSGTVLPEGMEWCGDAKLLEMAEDAKVFSF